jgi:hypothetical protein
MAKVTYHPDDEQIAEGALPENTELFGYHFEGHKPVEVTNHAHLRKFAGHPFFKVTGYTPVEAIDVVRTAAERESAMLGQGSKEAVTGQPVVAPAVQPVQPQPETPAKVTPGNADKPDGDSDLRAVHRGRGSFSVVKGEKDEEVVGGLTKAEAEEFNNLDAKAKAEYLKAAGKVDSTK